MNKAILFRLLTVAAMGLLVLMYFQPIWWVSLKAPNYPPEAFPDGVRIHFHMNGVFNGCQKRETTEIQETEALDCVHEMDTINHYVGMYPIASGGPIERALSGFLFAFMLVGLCAFMLPKRVWQSLALFIGFSLISAAMLYTLTAKGGVQYFSDGYFQSLLKNMDLEMYDIEAWTGIQAMQESYHDSLGMYFRDLTVIKPKVEFLATATYTVAGLLIGAMLMLVVGVWLSRWFYWLLVLIPILLPVFFVLDYAAWLWWFGHTLNEMGAFTVKPFMPTVFGDGKVAQFSTHSYPYIGFFMMLATSALLILAGLLRRKQLQEQAA
jgi:hypothetical protein